jgi:hypothetical protein
LGYPVTHRKGRSRESGLFFLTKLFLRSSNMALVKYGGGIVQASGSIAGVTHARNRFGNYIRSRTKPVNPSSQIQKDVRTVMAYLTAYWASTVTPTQRIAWATYAAAIAMKNRLGETVYLTGFNHFIRSNVEFKRHLHAVTAPAPTILTLPEQDPTFAISASLAANKLSVVFAPTALWALEAGAYMMVYMGQPRSATRNFFAGPWRWAGNILGTSPTAPTSPQLLDPPYTLTVGQVVTCYARIRRVDGRISEPMTSSCIVAA